MKSMGDVRRYAHILIGRSSGYAGAVAKLAGYPLATARCMPGFVDILVWQLIRDIPAYAHLRPGLGPKPQLPPLACVCCKQPVRGPDANGDLICDTCAGKAAPRQPSEFGLWRENILPPDTAGWWDNAVRAYEDSQ